MENDSKLNLDSKVVGGAMFIERCCALSFDSLHCFKASRLDLETQLSIKCNTRVDSLLGFCLVLELYKAPRSCPLSASALTINALPTRNGLRY